MNCSNRAEFRLHGVLGKKARVCRYHMKMARSKEGFQGAWQINTARLKCSVVLDAIENFQKAMAQAKEDVNEALTVLEELKKG